MRRHRTTGVGRTAAVLGAASLLVASCSGDDGSATDPSTTTSAPSATVACVDGTGPTPVLLADAPGTETVVDLVARPSGQLVAIGTSIWTREPGEAAWAALPSGTPLAPDQRPTAIAAAADGEVWVATSDAAGDGGVSQISRSADLVAWASGPLVVDGTPSTATINAMTLIDDAWFALVQDREDIALVSSADGRDWETQAAVPVRSETGPGKALFDVADGDGDPLSVGFTIGDSLRPLVVSWPADGAPTEDIAEQAQLDQVRLWGLTALADGRRIVAGDQVTTDPTGEATALTAALYVRSDSGALDLVTTLPSPLPFAVPSDLVVIGNQVVVAGAIGDTRRTLSPAVWTVCLRPE